MRWANNYFHTLILISKTLANVFSLFQDVIKVATCAKSGRIFVLTQSGVIRVMTMSGNVLTYGFEEKMEKGQRPVNFAFDWIFNNLYVVFKVEEEHYSLKACQIKGNIENFTFGHF